MKRSKFFALLIAAVPTVALAAADATPPNQQSMQQSQMRDQDIYGWQMMTPEERTAFHAKMRSATTDAERNKIRQEHHDLMVERAKDRGITLPPDMPARGMGPESGMGPGGGMGMGQGGGMGGGMGPGGGAGSGRP